MTVLSFECDQESIFSELYGDQSRFEQIFINFISNAFKFTHHEGRVEVIVKS